MENHEKTSEASVLSQKAEEFLKKNSEAKILELIEDLAYQNEEKAKRADELLIANKELVFQNKEKTKRAEELVIANKELAFQNEEKAKRADELLIANKELIFQSEEKIKRAAELIIAKEKIAVQEGLIYANNQALILSQELKVHHIELEALNAELLATRSAAESAAEKYLELYDFAPTGYLSLSNLGEINEINLYGAKMLGKKPLSLQGVKFGFFVSNDTKPIFNQFSDTVFTSKVEESCEVTLSEIGNPFIYVHITGIVNKNGEQCLLTMVDITERKHAEKEIILTRDEANKANLAKSEFLSRMSHELRTPMNSILGFAQLMEMGETKPSHKKWLNNIRNSGKHLLSLINEVLELAGIESGKQILTPEPVVISAIIHEISDVVQILADKRNISIVFFDSPANSLVALADKLRLKQVLLNLTSNAIKYNREGGSVTIKTALQSTDSHGNASVRISISDTGYGIKREDITKLFQPFGRIGANQTKTEGTGLGLVVVKELMKAMNGAVGVASEVGVGSTFWVELPLTENMKSDKQQNKENIKLTADSVRANKEPGFQNENELLARSSGHEKTGTILYIEDNVSNTELVEQILLNHRPAIHLVSHTNGAQAVSLAIEHTPDLILLDLDLPDIKGFEVIRLLQAEEKTMSIPVVIVSADAMVHQIEKLMNTGAVGYLTKPLDIPEFLKVIDVQTGLSKLQR